MINTHPLGDLGDRQPKRFPPLLDHPHENSEVEMIA